MLPTYQELPRRTNSFDGYCLSQPTALNIMLEIQENHYALAVNLKDKLKDINIASSLGDNPEIQQQLQPQQALEV